MVKNEFRSDKNGVYRLKQNEEEEKISDYIEIDTINYDIDSEKFNADIRYSALGKEKIITLDRGEYLNRNSLLSLQSKGMDVTHENIKYLVKYFKEQEHKKTDNIRNIHSKLGFSKYNGKDIYKLKRCIGCNSNYVGNYNIGEYGERDRYINMLIQYVIGRCQLELAICMGLSAIVLAYIGDFLGLGSMIFHIVGNSTTGKTSALKLAISPFGTPNQKDGGLFGSYNGTDNALIGKLRDLIGVPYALDEISMSNTKNFTKFVYSVSNGVDKERLNKNCEFREKGKWLTTLLSNGEKSLIESSNKNAGILARVTEFRNVNWTKDAQSAELINKTILETHGHLGVEFAEYIMELNKEKLIELYDNVKDDIYVTIKERVGVDNMTGRVCSKYSIILLTALLFQDMLDVELDIDGITNLIVDSEKDSLAQRNFKTYAIDYIKQYVSRYKSKFENGDYIPFDSIGKIISKDNNVEVQMNKIAFGNMLREGKFEDNNIVLRELKEAGYLNCEKDRYTRRRKNKLGYIEEVYIIRISD
ncbi:Superfamily II helicase and inactivated derivatives [uncultured Clostridium sp.]|uniref:DUF927 domain-containing protein n=1 Tax=uncultured Clostridium sp. TaxID=59620 RepID=UPI00082336E5|nr:DUF927 domain-containing protein [uncultured Clostridium sp.]SCK02042.1 Superfamily II helicase and inactivated derivatives [uncultured Clostridium sp.]